MGPKVDDMAIAEPQTIALFGHDTRKHVYLWRAQKLGDEPIGRTLREIERTTGLFDS